MTTFNLSYLGGAAAQFLDNSANPLSGGLVYTYLAGTTTPVATYMTEGTSTPHSNPIVLDAAGRVPGGQIWYANGILYKFVIKDANGVTIGTYDNIPSFVAASAATIDYLAGGTGAVSRSIQSKLREFVSIGDYGADSTGSASSNTALTNAQNYSQWVFIPSGTFRISSNLTVTSSLWMPKGAMFSVDAGVTLTINGSFEAGIYQVFTGSGTVVFGGGTATINELPEWRGSQPVATCYGDSFTMGFSGGISYDQSYPALIAKAMNWNIPIPVGGSSPGVPSSHVGNQAYGGSQIASIEQLSRIMAHTTTNDDIQWILTGINDSRAYGTSPSGNTTYYQSLASAIAWMCIPDTEKIPGNESNTSIVIRSGTGWVANTTWYNGKGYQTNVQGDTFGFTCHGDTVYLALPRDTTTTGLCSITIDGVDYGTHDFSGSVATVQYSQPYNMGFVRISGLSNGYHGVILTKISATSASDYMRVDWVAGVTGAQGSSNTGIRGGPRVYVGNCCRLTYTGYADGSPLYNHSNEGVTSYYNEMIAQLVRDFAGDGMNIALVDASKYFDPYTGTAADNIHPNPLGHQMIANAFLEIIDERKVHPKDRGDLSRLQDYIRRSPSTTSLGIVTQFFDGANTTMFGGGNTNTTLSYNLQIIDGNYWRINNTKATWTVVLSNNTSPQLYYKAPGTGQITSWDTVIDLNPSIQPAWQTPTLVNSWVALGGSPAWQNPQYRIDSTGVVHLQGSVKDGTVGASIFVLPSGYRPGAKIGFAVCANNAFGFLTIETDGAVSLAVGSNVFVNLDGITFKIP